MDLQEILASDTQTYSSTVRSAVSGTQDNGIHYFELSIEDGNMLRCRNDGYLPPPSPGDVLVFFGKGYGFPCRGVANTRTGHVYFYMTEEEADKAHQKRYAEHRSTREEAPQKPLEENYLLSSDLPDVLDDWGGPVEVYYNEQWQPFYFAAENGEAWIYPLGLGGRELAKNYGIRLDLNRPEVQWLICLRWGPEHDNRWRVSNNSNYQSQAVIEFQNGSCTRTMFFPGATYPEFASETLEKEKRDYWISLIGHPDRILAHLTDLRYAVRLVYGSISSCSTM